MGEGWGRGEEDCEKEDGIRRMKTRKTGVAGGVRRRSGEMWEPR